MLFDVYLHLKKTGSTMDVAKKIAHSFSPPFIITSEIQDKSYGQMGRKWFSPDGGLWFTEVISFSGTKPLSLFISIIIVRTLEKHIHGIKVKWPNDIYLNGKKLGGILTTITNKTAIVGIGINVENDIPKAIKDISVSLKSRVSLNKNILLKEILSEQEKYWKIFLSKGFTPFVNFYNTHLIFLNKSVIIKGKGIIEGTVLGVSASGGLLIKSENEIKTIFSGTVIKY